MSAGGLWRYVRTEGARSVRSPRAAGRTADMSAGATKQMDALNGYACVHLGDRPMNPEWLRYFVTLA